MRRAAATLGAIGLVLVLGCGEPAGTVEEQPIPTVDDDTGIEPVDPSGEETFRVRFETTAGEFVVEVHPDWAPKGAERFRELVEDGLYDGNRFFRVVPGFVVQWGIHGDPAISSQWERNNIPDDPRVASNTRGRVTFATSGPNSRTTQIFVNFGNNTGLDSQGFAPFGEVVEGMDVVDGIHSEYGQRPDQGLIQRVGNAYLDDQFPKLDHIIRATIEEPTEAADD